MNFKRIALLATIAVCVTTAALGQEQATTASTSPDEGRGQEQCVSKADHNNLDKDLRATFMTECLAGAELNHSPKT